jgi:hypothetical protein
MEFIITIIAIIGGFSISAISNYIISNNIISVAIYLLISLTIYCFYRDSIIVLFPLTIGYLIYAVLESELNCMRCEAKGGR